MPATNITCRGCDCQIEDDDLDTDGEYCGDCLCGMEDDEREAAREDLTPEGHGTMSVFDRNPGLVGTPPTFGG